MKQITLVLFAMLLPTLAPAQDSAATPPSETVASPDPVDDASKVALAWLALVDEGAYGKSWMEGAALFRLAISQTDWIEQVRAVRQPLGSVSSRELIDGQYTTALPQAPDGEYVVLQFKTSFEGKAGAVETITPMKDSDGAWRVAGYYIR